MLHLPKIKEVQVIWMILILIKITYTYVQIQNTKQDKTKGNLNWIKNI